MRSCEHVIPAERRLEDVVRIEIKPVIGANRLPGRRVDLARPAVVGATWINRQNWSRRAVRVNLSTRLSVGGLRVGNTAGQAPGAGDT